MNINWSSIWSAIKSGFVAAEPALEEAGKDVIVAVIAQKFGTSRLNRKYGHIKDDVDLRDKKICLSHLALGVLPQAVSNMDLMVPIYDQATCSGCTGFSFAAQFEAERIKQGLPPMGASQLFPYYNARVDEGDPYEDNGAQIRDVQKAAARCGVCTTATWPTDLTKVTTQPVPEAYTEALLHKSISYQSVPQDLIVIKSLLANRYTINLGIQVYESFETDAVMKSGDVPMPIIASEACLGGHAVDLIGYDDVTQRFTFRNSWGTSVGKQGYFTIPYAYILNPDLTSDLWALELVGG